MFKFYEDKKLLNILLRLYTIIYSTYMFSDYNAFYFSILFAIDFIPSPPILFQPNSIYIFFSYFKTGRAFPI